MIVHMYIYIYHFYIIFISYIYIYTQTISHEQIMTKHRKTHYSWWNLPVQRRSVGRRFSELSSLCPCWDVSSRASWDAVSGDCRKGPLVAG